MIQYVVNEIRRLSQDEGYYDNEIANMLGITRVTVFRTRTKHKIPTVNLSNRKDKAVVCNNCGNSFVIRRCEHKVLCETCAKLATK